ncbi:MAG: Lrp/AsnC ligand binding domain-containing protein [Nitrosotalea sp.]
MPTAYVLLNGQPNSEVEIISKIKEIVKDNQSAKCEIQGVYGVYDVIAKVECESMDDIRNMLGKIRRVNKIVSTITMLISEEQEV